MNYEENGNDELFTFSCRWSLPLFEYELKSYYIRTMRDRP